MPKTINNVSRETIYMNNNSQTGKTGEDLACDYLKRKSYKILERNHRQKWGELDIITIAPDKTLVFVEVKTLRMFHVKQYGNDSAIAALLPEENLTKAKLEKVKRTSQMFADQHPELIKEDKGWRIDLIAITLTDKENQINHYENI